MSEKHEHENESASKWQKMFDNVWLLFVISLVISTIVFNIWGISDLLNVPPAP